MAPLTILITGCSSPQGIGFAAARTLAQRGHRVHATVRDHSSDAQLRDGLEQQITIHDLDLTKPATLDATLAAVLDDDGGRLDVLVNNAGYGLIGGVEQVDLDQARRNFETNFFGTMELIQRVLPVMRAQQGGHIVNVSTIFAAGLCPPALGYYIASKAALETACQALAVELARFAIRVTNYQPGPVMTELSREWGNRFDADADPLPSLSDDLYRWIAGGEGPAPQPPAEVAEALAELIESEPAGLSFQSGPSAHAYTAAALRDPSRAGELQSLLAALARSAGAAS